MRRIFFCFPFFVHPPHSPFFLLRVVYIHAGLGGYRTANGLSDLVSGLFSIKRNKRRRMEEEEEEVEETPVIQSPAFLPIEFYLPNVVAYRLTGTVYTYIHFSLLLNVKEEKRKLSGLVVSMYASFKRCTRETEYSYLPYKSVFQWNHLPLDVQSPHELWRGRKKSAHLPLRRYIPFWSLLKTNIQLVLLTTFSRRLQFVLRGDDVA